QPVITAPGIKRTMRLRTGSLDPTSTLLPSRNGAVAPYSDGAYPSLLTHKRYAPGSRSDRLNRPSSSVVDFRGALVFCTLSILRTIRCAPGMGWPVAASSTCPSIANRLSGATSAETDGRAWGES